MSKHEDFINNEIIKTRDKGVLNTNLISDGYHTFGELYEHRIELYIKLCEQFSIPADINSPKVWRSMRHSDGSIWDGWFLLGIGIEEGDQITYHIPMDRWNDCKFAEELLIAPRFDGHTSKDVLERLKTL